VTTSCIAVPTDLKNVQSKLLFLCFPNSIFPTSASPMSPEKFCFVDPSSFLNDDKSQTSSASLVSIKTSHRFTRASSISFMNGVYDPIPFM